jgi:DNA-binding MarR family transcriptional regulator
MTKYLEDEVIHVDDDILVDEALSLLPELGRLLHCTTADHPLVAGRTIPQVKAILHIFGRGRCTVGELAQGLNVSMPTASELVDRLVDDGLVERGVNPADRRQVLVWLLPETEAAAQELDELRRARLRAAVDRLDPTERPIVIHGLRALAEALRETVAAAERRLVP